MDYGSDKDLLSTLTKTTYFKTGKKMKIERINWHDKKVNQQQNNHFGSFTSRH